MARVNIVPGATIAGDNIDLPNGSPPIGVVVTAQIIRLGSSFSLSDHTLDTQVAVGGAVTNALGHDATPELETAAGANVSIAGAISAHSSSGANPIVAAVPTRVDEDTITLDVNTEDGDIVELAYVEVGQYLQVS